MGRGMGFMGGGSHLDVGEVDAVEVAEHLRDLGAVLQHGARRLRQVVEGGVAAQRLRQGARGRQLHPHHLLRDVNHGGRQPALQALGEVADGLRQGAWGGTGGGGLGGWGRRGAGGHGERGELPPPAGGIGNCGSMGFQGGEWSCRPLVAGLGIAALRGPRWEMVVLLPGGGIGNCSSGGSRVGSGVLPPAGGIGNCSSVGSRVGNGGSAPWWGRLGIAAVQGSEGGIGCCPLVAGLGIAVLWGTGWGMVCCSLVVGLGIAAVLGSRVRNGGAAPGGGIGNCSHAGVMGVEWGCCPLVGELGIAAVQGSQVGNGGAAPWWWDWELQPCRGRGGGMELLLPGGGIRNCSCAGVMGGEWGCCPLVAGCGVWLWEEEGSGGILGGNGGS